MKTEEVKEIAQQLEEILILEQRILEELSQQLANSGQMQACATIQENIVKELRKLLSMFEA